MSQSKIQFDDYHRTVTGYHGTSLSSALLLINRISDFKPSTRAYDWLGDGIYFWEYSPRQALSFAQTRQKQRRKIKNPSHETRFLADEQLAVVACTIRLGFCFDLTEPENVHFLEDMFHEYKSQLTNAQKPIPKNTRKYRKLDREVFEFAYKMIERQNPSVKVDSARGIYVPAEGGKRFIPGSWISKDTHIQLCVRNPSNILGIWLHEPRKLEVDDVCKTLQTRQKLRQQNHSQDAESDADDVGRGED